MNQGEGDLLFTADGKTQHSAERKIGGMEVEGDRGRDDKPQLSRKSERWRDGRNDGWRDRGQEGGKAQEGEMEGRRDGWEG